jgi:2-(1,2-epoxy-1,2-dihydrophenyl)acetyl-CoA isomerase
MVGSRHVPRSGEAVEGDHAFETLAYRVEGGIAHLRLDRPDRRNAIDARMFGELGEACAAAADDPAVRAVVVSGEGPSFCSGIDLALLAELAGLAATAGQEEGGVEAFVHHAQRPFRLLASMGKPTVAAVRGHALGAGFQLALACDLRVAASDARFGMLEVRYGIVPDLGGIHHLTRLVGPARAKELVWSTRTVDASEADRLGLLAALVEPNELEQRAEALARAVAEHSPTAVRLAKSLIDGSSARSLDEELDAEAAAQAEALGSAHHREAVAAFLEGRAPRFGPEAARP